MKKFMIIIAATAGLAASTAVANAHTSHGGGHGGGGGVLGQILGGGGLEPIFNGDTHRGRHRDRRNETVNSSRDSENQSNNFGDVCSTQARDYNLSISKPIGSPCMVDSNKGTIISR